MRLDRPWIARPVVLVALLALAPAAIPAPGYLRYPDLHGDRLVFCAEGDIWMVAAGGGTARRITSHVGEEYFPKFSPDGERIAFTGEYDGNRDVFVMPATGGEPRRLTWHPGADEVLGWTPEGDAILFRTRRASPHGDWLIFLLSPDGGEPQGVPVSRAARLAIDPDSGRYAFNRTDRERRTWKRYRGGTNQDIWVGDPGAADFRQVTDFTGTDAMPMWHGGRIWFVSDLGGTYNLWSMRPDGSDRTQHTRETAWDIRWPSMSPDGRIAYMIQGDLAILDTASGEPRRVAVDLPSERTLTRRRYPDAEQYLSWFDLSPTGDLLSVNARGEIFSVPVKDGVTLNLTRGSGARESYGAFDGEGERVVFVSDAAREEAIHSIDAWGRGEATVLKPAGSSGWHLAPIYSPDGKWIAFADQTQTLYVMPADGGEPLAVDRSEQAEIRDYGWSPDGRYLAYTNVHRSGFPSVFVHEIETRMNHRITGDETADYSPAWDPDGRYLFFLSDRTINPILGQRDFQNVELKGTKPYLVLLQSDGKDPFRKDAGLPPEKDEEEEKDGKDRKEKADGDAAKKGKKEKGDKGEKDEDEEDETEPVKIDWDGLTGRLVEVPVPAGNYFGLRASASHLYYRSVPVLGMNEPRETFRQPVSSLMVFELEKKEVKTFADHVAGYDLEAKAGKIALAKGRGELYVVEAGAPPAGEALAKGKVSLGGVVIELDPREEWEQIFFEGWRHMRDFHWDETMSGVDWEAERDRYAALLPRVATREDLRDLMGELIGELNTSHTYVFGGDPGASPTRLTTGLLGADLSRQGAFFRVDRIYRGDPADLDRSPLEEPGVGVREGDYILAVNRRPPAPDRPFEANLENLAGKQVLLTVNGKPSTEGARDVVVTPLDSDTRLRYIDWVRRNREYVEQKTGGKIGYIHLPNMGTDGMVEFNRWFYPQLDREGMVVDVRWNGGGFVSQLIVERFRRKVIAFDRSRGGAVTSYPYRALSGPFVVLLNEEAGSDGDIFPYAIQQEGLAPIIGQRSWGGVIGIRLDKRLVDGGLLSQPEYAWWDPQHGWAMENVGVVPDIEVVSLPQDEARGVDAQLDRAIAEVMRLHAQHPPVKPTFEGVIPDKSREGYRRRETGPPGRP